MTTLADPIPNGLKQWWWFLVIGILSLITGIAILSKPAEGYISLSILFSLTMAGTGLSQIVFAISAKNDLRGWGWTLASGILDFALGTFLLLYPTVTMATLPFFIGFYLLFRGFYLIGASIDLNAIGMRGWGWVLTGAILLVVLGFLTLYHPGAGAIGIVAFSGTAFMVSGLASMLLAFQLAGGRVKITSTQKEKFMKKRIIIVGGGFAGLTLAKKLSNEKDFELIVVDVNNYHFFPPLLYQVSTAFIEPSNISYPYRKLFQSKKNVRFYMGKLKRVIPETNTIETDNGSLSYDYLVLAMGTETNFFGNENIRQNALPMKTIDDALNIRNHILLQMEKAVRSGIVSDRRKSANIVIAGGGPTGVEMAGMLAEMSNMISSKDYPEIHSRIGSIYLVDGSPALLGTMSKKAQAEAYRVLESLGVNIVLNTLVKDYVNDEVLLSSGRKISSSTLIWSSGVIAHEVKGLSKEVITKGRRILVDGINRVIGYENIFSIGDQCFQTGDKNYPNGHPQLAGVASEQGKLLALNLKRLEENKPIRPFTHHHKGAAAIISKYRAIVDLREKSFKGFIAWFVWLFAHIIPLIGFRNKLKLAANWFWSFITNDPTLRLIIRPDKKENELTKKNLSIIQVGDEKQQQS